MNLDLGTCTDNSGLVHVRAWDGEYTICGDAFDGIEGETDSVEWRFDDKKKAVTCPKCAGMVRFMKTLKIGKIKQIHEDWLP